MIIREWKNTMWGIFALTLYASMVNAFSPQGTALYISIAVGVLLIWIFGYRLYKSTDKHQVETRIKKHQEKPSDIFTPEKYELAVQTSSRALEGISSVITENYERTEIEKMLGILQEWKEANSFKWDNSTVYDELVIEGEMTNKLEYHIKHKCNTKTLSLRGILETSPMVQEESDDNDNRHNHYKNKETKSKDRYYTISGIRFCLTNVQPDEIGMYADWSISLDTTKTNGYYGIITDKKSTDK